MGYTQERGKKYRAFYRDANNKLRSKSFDKKGDADRWWKAAETDLDRGLWIDPDAGKITFREYAERWRAEQVHRPGTAVQVEGQLRVHVYPRIGERRMSTLRRSDLQALVKHLESQLSPTTIDVVMAWVGTIFKAAVLDRVIPHSPMAGVKLPPVFKRKAMPLPMNIIRLLIATIEERYRAILILGLGTGVRLGEALGLTIDRIDFEKKVVLIDRQLRRARGNVPSGAHGVSKAATPLFGPVKDKYNTPRTIPVPDEILAAIRDHIEKFGLGPEGLIFTNRYGGPLSQTVFNEAYRKVANPLGIRKGDGFHQFRHTYASALIHAGLSIKVIQERLGHTSAAMTLDVYGHLMEEDDDSTRVTVEGITRLALEPNPDNVVMLRPVAGAGPV